LRRGFNGWLVLAPIATAGRKHHVNVAMQPADYLVEKADECFRIARYARKPDITEFDVATKIEAMGNEFMTKAVEIETDRQRVRRKN
jgi:preprotein translocase subunit Sss1